MDAILIKNLKELKSIHDPYIKDVKIKKRFIKDFEKLIIEPLAQNADSAAIKYFNSREEFNEPILKQAAIEKKAIISHLNTELKSSPVTINYDLRIMSSVSAGINLIGDSDIDFGLLVKDLDPVKTFILTKELLALGYNFYKVKVNKHFPSTYQLRFNKIIKVGKYKIEIEVKIRDYDACIPIMKLHDLLDSMPKKLKILFTYAKYIIKAAVKGNANEYIYDLLKDSILNYFFATIKNNHYMM